jgi:outer membrane autotransporter protein
LSQNDLAALSTLNNAGLQGQLLLGLIGGLTPAQQKFALDDLSGQNHAVNLQIALTAPQIFIDTIESHVLLGSTFGNGSQYADAGIGDAQVAESGLLNRDPTDRGGVWARGYGVFGNASGVSNVSPFDSTRAGVIAGVDWSVAEGTVIGAAFDYQHTAVTFNDATGNSALNSYTGAVYGGWRGGPWYVSALGSGGGNNYTTLRNLGLGLTPAAGSFGGATFSVYGETGYLAELQGVNVAPFAAIDYVHARTDAFTETGGGASMIVSASSANATDLNLGVRASTTLAMGNGHVVPELRAAWQHDFSSPTQNITAAFVAAPGSPFTITGANFGRDAALVGVGLTGDLGNGAQAYVDYDGRFNGSFNEQAVSAGFRIKF